MTHQPGALVQATYMPHLGVGVIESTLLDRCIVSFEIDGDVYVDEFGQGELQPAKPTLVRTA